MKIDISTNHSLFLKEHLEETTSEPCGLWPFQVRSLQFQEITGGAPLSPRPS